MKKTASPIKKVKIKKKQFLVTKFDLTKKHRKSVYKKWQLKICDIIGVEPADSFNYVYRIQYKSNITKLNLNDIVINAQGRAFVVIKEVRELAMVVTAKPSVKEPYMIGTMAIIGNTKKK